MEEHSALSVTTGELVLALMLCAITIAVAIASYRRSRCLSGHPIWKSVIIGAVAALYWPLWLIFTLVNRKRIAQEWRDYRASRSRPGLELAGR